jgi:hypothetical protein
MQARPSLSLTVLPSLVGMNTDITKIPQVLPQSLLQTSRPSSVELIGGEADKESSRVRFDAVSLSEKAYRPRAGSWLFTSIAGEHFGRVSG